MENIFTHSLWEAGKGKRRDDSIKFSISAVGGDFLSRIFNIAYPCIIDTVLFASWIDLKNRECTRMIHAEEEFLRKNSISIAELEDISIMIEIDL